MDNTGNTNQEKQTRKYEKQAAALRNYFDSHGIKYKEVADELGIAPPTISNILSGRDTIGKSRARKLVKHYGFDMLFLLTGEGELFPQKPAIKQTIVGENNTQVAEVGGNCPSMADLLAKVASLERINKAKDNEITFLRDMINRLIPGQKLQDNGNE